LSAQVGLGVDDLAGMLPKLYQADHLDFKDSYRHSE
jgi:hypothetical protein